MSWRQCPGCGYGKSLEPGEVACPVCTDRGYAVPKPAGRQVPRPTLGGARALEILEGQYGDRDLAETRTRERYRAADVVTDGDSALKWLGENAAITIRHEYRG